MTSSKETIATNSNFTLMEQIFENLKVIHDFNRNHSSQMKAATDSFNVANLW